MHNKLMHAYLGNTTIDFDDTNRLSSIFDNYSSNYDSLLKVRTLFASKYQHLVNSVDFVLLHKDFNIDATGYSMWDEHVDINWLSLNSIIYYDGTWCVLSQLSGVFDLNKAKIKIVETPLLTTKLFKMFDKTIAVYQRRHLFKNNTQTSCMFPAGLFDQMFLYSQGMLRGQDSSRSYPTMMMRRAGVLDSCDSYTVQEILFVIQSQYDYVLSSALDNSLDYLHKSIYISKLLFSELPSLWRPYQLLLILFVLSVLSLLISRVTLFSDTIDVVIAIPVHFTRQILQNDVWQYSDSHFTNYEPVNYHNTNTTSPPIVIQNYFLKYLSYVLQFVGYSDIMQISYDIGNRPYKIIFVIIISLFVVVSVCFCLYNIICFVQYYLINNHCLFTIVGKCMPPAIQTTRPLAYINATPMYCDKCRTCIYGYGPCFNKMLSICNSCLENVVKAAISRQIAIHPTDHPLDNILNWSRLYHRYLIRKPFNPIEPRSWALRFGGKKNTKSIESIG
jgi:hypothetical protein